VAGVDELRNAEAEHDAHVPAGVLGQVRHRDVSELRVDRPRFLAFGQ
jgi:hypothetical protein